MREVWFTRLPYLATRWVYVRLRRRAVDRSAFRVAMPWPRPSEAAVRRGE